MIPGQPPQPAPMAQPFPASPPPQGNAPPPVTIDAVVKLFRDDRMRGFRIDIETDSLVDADQKQERADATELVTAIGGFFKEFGPIVQAMPPLAPLASGLLQFAVRRYKVGAELEELIEKTMGDVAQHLANPPPPKPDPTEALKLQGTQAKVQGEIAREQIVGQTAQQEAASKQQAQKIEIIGKVMDHHATVAEHHLNAQAMERQAQADQRAHDLKIEQMDHQAKMAKQKPKGDK